MNHMCKAFGGALLALAASTATAAVEIEDRLPYLAGTEPQAGCAWEPNVVAGAVEQSEGALKPKGQAGALKLSLQVLQLKHTPGGRSNTYNLTLRADVRDNGKLVATRDFAAENSYKPPLPGCDTLKSLGTGLGENVADWVTKARFTPCGEGCQGLRPDEPIVVAPEIELAKPDAINSTVRDECRWPSAMVQRLVKAHNEYDPAPRARLEARAVDAATFKGRRLVLRVTDMHAVGGGGITGPKWLHMTGELRDGDTVFASFVSQGTSGRGLTTCRSVDALSDETAYWIVEWLRGPSLNAELK